MIALPKLILASGSPRRAEILRSVGWEFTIVIPDIDESELPGEIPEDYVERLAKEKAAAVAGKTDGGVILAADTTVVLDGQIMGKPVDLDDARRMLRALSGKQHDVFTGVAVVHDGIARTGIQQTSVNFAELSDAEIEFLTLVADPLDRAGAYAVQAQAALFVEGIKGDYWNVVGLPISLVYRLITTLEA